MPKTLASFQAKNFSKKISPEKSRVMRKRIIKKFQKVLQFKKFRIFSTMSETNIACAMRAIQFESMFYIVILKIMFKICSQIATTGFSSEL